MGLLRKRPINLGSLRIVATPYHHYTLLRRLFWNTPTHPHSYAHAYAPTHTWSLAVSLCGYRPTCTSSRKGVGEERERERERGVSDRIWRVFAYIHKKMYTCVMGAWVYMRVCKCMRVNMILCRVYEGRLCPSIEFEFIWTNKGQDFSVPIKPTIRWVLKKIQARRFELWVCGINSRNSKSFQHLACRDRASCGSLFNYFRSKLSRSTDRNDSEYMCACMDACQYKCKYTHKHMHAHMSTYKYTHVYTFKCMYVAYMHVWIHACMYACMHVCMYKHTHTHRQTRPLTYCADIFIYTHNYTLLMLWWIGATDACVEMARALGKNMCSVHGKIRGAKQEERNTYSSIRCGARVSCRTCTNCCISVPPHEDIFERHNARIHTSAFAPQCERVLRYALV